MNVTSEEVRMKQDEEKHLESSKVEKLWVVKAHSEIIRSIEYVMAEKLIITSSYDKKVKIFSAEGGRFIDSLQQNY